MHTGPTSYINDAKLPVITLLAGGKVILPALTCNCIAYFPYFAVPSGNHLHFVLLKLTSLAL
jgi:hypothetical protein